MDHSRQSVGKQDNTQEHLNMSKVSSLVYLGFSNQHQMSGIKPTHTSCGTYINYHFTALARSYLCEDLQDEGLGDIPGQVPHIPAKRSTDGGLESLSNRN